MTAHRVRVGGVELVVVEIGGVSEAPQLGALSDAERAVARLACEGRTDREIAALRRTSVKTVANQMHRLFKKLGVCSRAELVATLHMIA